MGSIFSYQCCNKPTAPPKSVLSEGHMYKIGQDYQYFYGQDWFGTDKILFEPDKFIFLYQDYMNDQMQLQKQWIKADFTTVRHGELSRNKGQVLNTRWQYLIRRGVPCNLTKVIIMDIFKLTYVDCESEYLSALKVVFKNKPIPKSFKHVPLFGCQTQDDDEQEFDYLNQSQKQVQLIIKCQILNQSGIDALIRILWVVKQQYFQLEYNPMLLHIIILLFTYLSEAQTYCVLQFMIKDSQNSMADGSKLDLRWHLIMNEEQFKETAASFYESISNRSATFNQIYAKMQAMNFNYFELFSDMSITLMLTYIPFSLSLKVFVMYLNEGIKIYFRLFYAVVRMLKVEILNCKSSSSIKQLIRNKLLNLSTSEQYPLIKQAFKLRLNNADVPRAKLSVAGITNQTCYLPIPSHTSELLTSQQFETLWDWMPSYYKLYDPHLIFNTKQDGYSLKYLYNKCTPYLQYPVLLVVKCTDQQLIGAVCDKMIMQTDKYIGNGESFLFQLEPNAKKHIASNKNNDFFYGCNDYFAFGSGKFGPAMQIDQDLHKLQLHDSDTYEGSPKGANKCMQIEIYYLM